jgi:hypothetical protein
MVVEMVGVGMKAEHDECISWIQTLKAWAEISPS